MKFILPCIVMLVCFAFAGSSSTAGAEPSVPAAQLVVDDDGDSVNSCGGNVCGGGTYCCNASCGTCVPKGMECSQESCN